MTLQRLVLSFKPEGVEIRALYRSKAKAGPGTVSRRREVVELAGAGLREALAALEGPAESIGTSGFETREDTFLCTKGDATPIHKKPARRGAA